MRNFTLKISFLKKFSKATFVFSLLLFISFISQSQSRQYSLVYSDNIKGGCTIFGNTLMQIITNKKVDSIKMNDNRKTGYSSYGNDYEDMEYVDIDGSTGTGKATRNSSSADLILPSGTNTIKLARLYWGGRVKDSDFDLTKTANKSIKIRKGTTGTYSDVAALGIDKTPISNVSSGYTQYQAYADITAFIKNNGAGTYEVGNVPLSTGSIDTGSLDNGGNHGGWSIVVVYENNAVSYNSIRVYDGFAQVYDKGNFTISTVTLTGLDVPSGTLAAEDAKMGVVAWEGDANIIGDFLKINGYTFSNAINPGNNPWNGTITDNGVYITTKNPNFTNQMGIDIDMFDVGKGYGIVPNANLVTLQFGTEKDQYYPGVFTFTIKMKDPAISLDKTVSDANHNHLAESGEVLTYTLKGGNIGDGNANNVVIADTLPGTVTFLPGSLKVISAPGITAGTKTDNAADDIAEYVANGSVKSVVFRIGTGATATSGGTLAPNKTYEVQFQVTVNNPGTGLPVPSIMNIARITSRSDAGVNFVDDGTAIINPQAGPMPVTLTNFTAAKAGDNTVKIHWSTSMEINCSKFIIQRSYDGNTFTDVQTVAGNGTTNLFHSYTSTDDVYTFNGVTVYYRLKQIDIDGKQNLSKIITIKLANSTTEISVSPNPFTDYINVKTNWNTTEVISIKIFDVLGKEMLSLQKSVIKGANTFKIDGLSNLSSGNYYLQLISPNQKITQKITK